MCFYFVVIFHHLNTKQMLYIMKSSCVYSSGSTVFRWQILSNWMQNKYCAVSDTGLSTEIHTGT